MLRLLSHKLKKYAIGWLISFLFLLDGFFMGYLMPSIGASMTGGSAKTGPIDLMFFYTPQTAYKMIASYGDSVRSSYRAVELTVDIAYPMVYTLFFSLLITWLFNKAFDPKSRMQRLNVVPFGAGLFDLFENLGIVTMLSIHPATPVSVAWLTTIFTMTKWSFVGASLILMIIGVAAIIARANRRNRKHHHHTRTHTDGGTT
ncbi:MAG: hypothetical protein HY863_19945 [Chloroflexi bacterium]|nr:hypothetical protein [Chloroflexota bacterium]